MLAQLRHFYFQGDEEKTLRILGRIHFLNTGSRDYQISKIKPNEEFDEARKKKNVCKTMLDQTVSLIREYPRSIGIMSALQFGVYFVSNGMLLFLPDILNQTANYMHSSSNDSIKLCTIVERAIEAKNNRSSLSSGTCNEELSISTYYYAIMLEVCYVLGFLTISLLVNYIGRLTIFCFIFFTTGLSGFLIVLVSDPTIAQYLYVWLLVSGVNNNLLNTVTYDLFPTNLRALAMSLSLMCGRLGKISVTFNDTFFNVISCSCFNIWKYRGILAGNSMLRNVYFIRNCDDCQRNSDVLCSEYHEEEIKYLRM